MLITDEYLAQQKALHAGGQYGISSGKWAEVVRQLSLSGRKSILDYGCGQQKLKEALGPAYTVACYDPAIAGLDAPPQPADVVVCTDVLEHIEPECLDAVLADLARLTNEIALLVVHTGPAKKMLADGRNAHLIQQGSRWWTAKLIERFEPLKTEWHNGKDFLFICRPIKS